MTLIYALAAGETERYMEALLSSRCKTAADVAAVKAAASKDGWHDFRVVTATEDAPNFAGAVA